MKTDKARTCTDLAVRVFGTATKAAVSAAILASICATSVSAAVIGYDLVISPTLSSGSFGTGVSAGDIITGTMFFDSSDLTPNGSRQRSNRPGGDTLVVGGVPFDNALDQDLWVIGFDLGAPVCLGDLSGDGCGNGNSQVYFFQSSSLNIDLKFADNGFGSITFSDTPIPFPPLPPGTICACITSITLSTVFFNYTFEPQVTVSEPGSLALMLTGLLAFGLAIRARRQNTLD